ncbi:virulence-associated E family protein [Hyphomicrobium sp. 99]|uniref:virulence-associated E family protein n=1 Tax=Hyphomicrobium sp. 99 TaxID=1163419 RepID=UPI0006967CAA|nr:virulence-associated E family protein [Hyphomicrobium sp. 99]
MKTVRAAVAGLGSPPSANDASESEQPASYDISAEQALLGAVLLQNRFTRALPPGFCGDTFYHPLHQAIWDQITRFIAEGKTADAVDIGDALKHFEHVEVGLTVPNYVLQLVSQVPSLLSAHNYAATILDHARQRWRRLDDQTWKNDLIKTAATLTPKPLVANALTALRSPAWRTRLAFDEFAMTITLEAPAPFETCERPFRRRKWTDNDDMLATEWLQSESLTCGREIVQPAIETVAREATYHPVRAYLSGIHWDRASRIDHFANRYLGATPGPYAAAVGRCMLISAVARVMNPGCKADHVVVIEGAQGIGKSSAIAALAGDWFTDELADLGSKDAAMQIRGRLIVEISELDSMSRAEVSRVKAFISRTTDRFRPPYGRHIIECPRECIFVGTTNAETYLNDETGARRFWPIRAGSIDVAAIRRDRDQLWAEALFRYERGDPWWLTGEAASQAALEQEERYADDPWEPRLRGYLERRNEVSVSEILTDGLAIEVGRQGQAERNRVARCLKRFGWVRHSKRINGEPRHVYRRMP